MTSLREQREKMVDHLRQEITKMLEETKDKVDSVDSIRSLKTTENRLKKLFDPSKKKQGAALEAQNEWTRNYIEKHKEERREKRKLRYKIGDGE